MANDRLYLVCDDCREALFIYKYYPSGGWWCSDGETLARVRQFEDWLQEHAHFGGDYRVDRVRLVNEARFPAGYRTVPPPAASHVADGLAMPSRRGEGSVFTRIRWWLRTGQWIRRGT